ncbi:MAG: FimD/PapC N-terminal domain-containing protein, partial [Chryseobacterium sp.]
NLFKGSGLSARLIERFNHPDQLEEGSYTVDIYVNERFIQRQSLYFSKNEDAKESVQACLSTSLLETAGILGDLEFRQLRETNPQAINDIKCLTLAQVAKGSKSIFDFSLLRLNLTVPQSLMKNIPRGYVNPSELDAGSSIAFINYTGNYYQTENRINNSNYESAFI